MRILIVFLSFCLVTACSPSDQGNSGGKDSTQTAADSSHTPKPEGEAVISQPTNPAYVDSVRNWVFEARNACKEAKTQTLKGEEWTICHFGDDLTSVEITRKKDGDLTGEHYLLKGHEVVYLSLFGEFGYDTEDPGYYADERALKGEQDYFMESLGHGLAEEELRVPIPERWDARKGDYEQLRGRP